MRVSMERLYFAGVCREPATCATKALTGSVLDDKIVDVNEEFLGVCALSRGLSQN
jgi:hypothetical protein